MSGPVERDGSDPAADEDLAVASTLAPEFEPGLDAGPDASGSDASDASDANGVEVLDEASLAQGDSVGEYVIERVLGSGGFGTVYEAVQPMIQKRVAIKVLAGKYSFDPKAVARARRERSTRARCRGRVAVGRLDRVDGSHVRR